MAQTTPPPDAPAAKTPTPAAKKTTTPARPPAGADRSTLTGPQPTGRAAAGVGPAAAAIRDAARQAEIEQLTKERDELRELIGEAPELAVLRAEVDALRQAAARGGVTRTARWTMSAGVAADLEVRGYATDPATGDAYVRDGDQVTVTARTGETRTVDMPDPSGAGDTPPAERK